MIRGGGDPLQFEPMHGLYVVVGLFSENDLWLGAVKSEDGHILHRFQGFAGARRAGREDRDHRTGLWTHNGPA